MITIPIYKRRLGHKVAASFQSVTGSGLWTVLFDFKESDK